MVAGRGFIGGLSKVGNDMSKKANRREVEMIRKRRMARANRLLGWVTFAAFLLPRLAPFLIEQGLVTLSEGLLSGLRSSFMFFIFLHGIAGVYLYGVPIFKWHPRVIQMMLGLVIFGVFILNRSFILVPALLRITEVLMWIPVGAHVLLGLRYLVHRVIRPSTYPATPYYLGGAIVRDFTR